MRGDGFRSDQDGDYIEIKAGDILDYGYLWEKWLQGDSITVSQWTFVPAGPSVVSATHDATTTAALISGCAAGTVYQVTNAVQTAGGLHSSRSFRIIVEA